MSAGTICWIGAIFIQLTSFPVCSGGGERARRALKLLSRIPRQKIARNASLIREIRAVFSGSCAYAANASIKVSTERNSEVLEERPLAPPLPQLIDPRLAKAMSHPTRVQALTVLTERAETPTEISKEIGEPVNNLCYHLGQLVKLDCIEPVSVNPAGGGRVSETVYRATRVPFLDDAAWEGMTRKEQQDFLSTYLKLVSKDLTEALVSGTFYDPGDNHLSRSPMHVDPAGWQEVVDLLDDTVEKLKDIQQSVNARNNSGSPQRMPVKVEILQFHSPEKT
jgi:hypothetical protein